MDTIIAAVQGGWSNKDRFYSVVSLTKNYKASANKCNRIDSEISLENSSTF